MNLSELSTIVSKILVLDERYYKSVMDCLREHGVAQRKHAATEKELRDKLAEFQGKQKATEKDLCVKLDEAERKHAAMEKNHGLLVEKLDKSEKRRTRAEKRQRISEQKIAEAVGALSED